MDDDGNRYLLIDEIEDHRTTEGAIPIEQGTYITRSGLSRPKRTTKGWQLFVRWKDGSANWVDMKDLKDSYPVQLAEYAINNAIQDQPAFAWWVGPTLRRKSRIIAAVNKRYHKRTHKFGLELPKSVKEALEIDRQTGTTHWRDALDLEMKNVRVAFEVFEDEDAIPPPYQQINCHMVFDIKMES